jgi:TatD DNase family protein
MIDVGSNLTCRQFKKHVHQIIDRAFKANIKCQIITGSNIKNSIEGLKLCNNPIFGDILRCTFGIHPHNASQYKSSVDSQIRNMLKNNNGKIVAVGETGLDYNRMNSTIEQQVNSFKAHVRIAIEHDLPLFLHERDAHNDFIKVLGNFKDKLPKVLVHSFTGNIKELNTYIERGFYISINGFIAIENRSQQLQKFVNNIPLNRLMIETDAPYMKPTGSPKTPTNCMEPYLLGLVVKKLAILYKTSELNIIHKTTQNAITFFNIKSN